MLKITEIKLEKISDIGKYLFIEKGLRGGISYIAKRYAKANNKYMSDYDSNKQSTFITYLDKNNLYGWSMSEYLPYKEFEWVENVDGFNVNSINEKSEIGYFLEVDLEYPDELHELHNDYPLAPEKLAVFYDMLSDHCKKVANKYEIISSKFRQQNVLCSSFQKSSVLLVFLNETCLFMAKQWKIYKKE